MQNTSTHTMPARYRRDLGARFKTFRDNPRTFLGAPMPMRRRATRRLRLTMITGTFLFASMIVIIHVPSRALSSAPNDNHPTCTLGRWDARTGYCATAFHETAPKSQKLLKKLETLELTERQAVARSAIAVVLTDGRVTPEEVRFLERLYKALRLPVDDVYSALHRGDVEPNSAASPVKATETASTGANGSRPRTVGVTIDPDRLARLREETKAVSNLLSDIFNEDTEIGRDESEDAR